MKSKIAITGATVFSSNHGEIKVWSPGTVWVEANRITDIQEGRIDAAARDEELEIIDARGWILLPGFINTHLHSHQTPLRSVPKLQNLPIEEWVNRVGMMQGFMSSEEYGLCTLGALVELALSGVTTAADMIYLFGNNAETILESSVDAARESGIRYHLVRSGMCNNETAVDAGMNPELLESGEAMLAGFKDAGIKYHDSSSDSMLQVAIGPCSLFDLSVKDCRKVARIAEELDMRVNLHFMESDLERDYLNQLSQLTPTDFLERAELAGENLWLVHCVHLTDDEIKFLADHKIKVASCPTSNARGEGIAPITELLSGGIDVGVGVDGFAGNDSGNFLAELKLFRILQGAREGRTYLSWEDTFKCATTGGASALGRHDLGRIEKGALADLIAFDLRESLSHAGHHHPVMSLFSCTPIQPVWAMVNGRVTIENGRHKTIDVHELAREIQSISDYIEKKYNIY